MYVFQSESALHSKKYFTNSDYSRFKNDIINAKIKQKKLSKSDTFKFVNNSDLDNEVASLAIKVELKAQQDKIGRLQAFDSSLFIGQSYFDKDGSQSFLIFQPIQKNFKILPGLKDTIIEWKYKGLPNKKLSLLLQEIITFTRRNVVNLFIVYELD